MLSLSKYRLLVLTILISEIAATLTTRDYIESKLKETKELFIRAYVKARASASEDGKIIYAGDWERLWHEEWEGNQPRVIAYADRAYIVNGRKILPLTEEADVFNDTNVIGEIAYSNSSTEPIRFIKSFLWNETLFLLVCQAEACTHYQGADISSLANPQVIRHKDLYPVDACFFERGQRVFVVISYADADEAGRSTGKDVPSRIYGWLGRKRRMQYVEEMETPPVSAVLAIEDGPSTILLLSLLKNRGTETGGDTKSTCLIYRLRDEDDAELISFLITNGPVESAHSFAYRGRDHVLLTGDEGFSGIYLWDGTAIQKWMEIPELVSSNLIQVMGYGNDTLLFVYNSDTLHVFEVSNDRCPLINRLDFDSDGLVLEMTTWQWQGSIMVAIVTHNLWDTYSVELWQLRERDDRSEEDESKEVWQCLDQLSETLSSNKGMIDELRDNVDAEERARENGLRDKNNLSSYEFVAEDELEISTVAELMAEAKKLSEYVEALSAAMGSMIITDDRVSYVGNVTVAGDAYFDAFVLDDLNVEFLNGERIEMDKYLISGIDQNFSVPLQGDNITIENIQVPSLCGLKPENWLRVNDTERTSLWGIDWSRASVRGDTLVIDGGMELDTLNTDIIDGLNLTEFLKDVFIKGENQIIRGNVRYEGPVKAASLTADLVNDHPAEQLITKATSQKIRDAFIETLQVDHLEVETVNDVPVDQAARVSQENVIKGKVVVHNLIIKDELIIDEGLRMPFERPTQIYKNVEISGDLYVKNLALEPGASLAFSPDPRKAYNMRDVVDSSWSRSKNQTIEGPVVLEKGATIDRLACRYLNGLAEDDFLYADSYELNDLENITFADLHVNGVRNEGTGEAKDFIDETSDYLMIKQPVRITQLSVDNMYTRNYNGIPVDEILGSNDMTLTFPGIADFEVVRVTDRMVVEDLYTKRINSESVDFLERALKLDEDMEVDVLRVDELRVHSIEIGELFGKDLEESLLARENIYGQPKVDITIDGDLDVDEISRLESINGQSVRDYVDRMKSDDPVDLLDTKAIKNLRVLKDVWVGTLNGRNVNDIFANALSRSRTQRLSELTVSDVKVRYLVAETINNRNVSELKFVDEPFVIYGDLEFSELHVHGDVVTRTLHGKDVLQVYEDMHVIPMGDPVDLNVTGAIRWDKPSRKSGSMSDLFAYAVTKNTDQVIDSAVTFEGSVRIDSLYLKDENSSTLKEIRDIVSDTVTNDSDEPIVIKGKKVFEGGLTVGELEVTNDLGINIVNGVDFAKTASEIYRKYSNDVITGHVTFLSDVKIRNLMTNSKIHGVALDDLATYDKRMPRKVHFQHLVIKNVTLHKLDGVNMDDFLSDRVTIDGNHRVYGDVRFDSSVTVLGGAQVSLVNGIKPEDFVLSSGNGTGEPIVIYGNKTFTSDVVIDGDLRVTRINDIDIQDMYENSCMRDEKVDVYGDLVFEGDVDALGNISVVGPVKGLDVGPVVERRPMDNESLANDFLKRLEDFEGVITKIVEAARGFGSALLYLEEDPGLSLGLAGALSARAVVIESTTRLDVQATESPGFCGLPSDCLCRRQYTIELLPSGECTLVRGIGAKVTFNFYEPSVGYALSVVSGAVSSSKRCSRVTEESETSAIFWTRLDNRTDAVTRNPIKKELGGFIADADRFIVNGRLYLMLAVFYDKSIGSHATDSLLYEFHLDGERIELGQGIPTNGAKSVHVFHVRDVGVFGLIGCVKGKAESLLLRFNETTGKFQLLQRFATGGSKHVRSVSVDDDVFVLLDNPGIEALQIFAYDDTSARFDDYQNLHFQSKLTGLDVFYAAEYGASAAFVVLTTKSGWFYVYEYNDVGKFKEKISHWMEDILILSAFRHMKENYLFAGSRSNSTVFKVIKSGLQ